MKIRFQNFAHLYGGESNKENPPKNGSRSDEKHNSEIEPIWEMSFGFSKFRMMESKSIKKNDPKIDPKFNRKYEKNDVRNGSRIGSQGSARLQSQLFLKKLIQNLGAAKLRVENLGT